MRKKRRFTVVSPEYRASPVLAPKPSPEQLAREAEQIRMLERVLEQFPQPSTLTYDESA